MRREDACTKEETCHSTSTSPEKPCLKDRAKAKGKRVLNIDATSEESSPKSSYDLAYEELEESPAFNSSKVLNKARIGPSGISDKAIAFIQGTADALVNPKAAIKQRATRNAARKLAKSNPYLNRKADLDFLEAHDDLEKAKGAEDKGHGERELERRRQDISDCGDRVEELERRRQSMRVAWITARHVQRVRVVDAVPSLPFPENSFFEKTDDCGYTEFQWGKWLAYKLLYITHDFTAQYVDDFEELPFDSDTLRRHVERLITVSAPLQAFISDLRRIYRWEDPARTGRWMALYFFLWYISHVMTFFYGYIFYSTVKNYYYPTSLRDLRQGLERTIDRGATAFKVGELMDKHGSNDWLGPLMEGLGPDIQVHIADFASLLEVLSNFYNFRNPYATIWSLFLVATFFTISALRDAEFTMKIWWLIVGLSFFICFPISSRYPRYRHLVAPWKWMIWNVPTDAEWSFQYLQERTAVAKASIISSFEDNNLYIQTGVSKIGTHTNDSVDSESDADSFISAASVLLDQERDIISFGCTYLHVPGRLVISTTSLRFESSVGKVLSYEAFDKPYTELIEMSKRQTHASVLKPLAKVVTGLDKLELVFRGENGSAGIHSMGQQEDAETVVLDNMRARDKAFNAILGFSGLRWQNLQQKLEKRKSITLDAGREE